MHFTIIKTTGEIIRYRRQPTVEKVKELINASSLESHLWGMFIKETDYDVEIITDAEFAMSNKPINKIVSAAMNQSLHWRNRSFIETTKSDIVICGDVLVVSEEELPVAKEETL